MAGKKCELDIESRSIRRSMEIGSLLGALIPAGTVISLEGGLGSGKTLFAKGICLGLGVPDEVISPSFVLVEEYRGHLPILHFDLYRLAKLEEVLNIGLLDAIDGKSVVIIEWGDKLPAGLVEFDVRVRFAIKGARVRQMRIECPEELYIELARSI